MVFTIFPFCQFGIHFLKLVKSSPDHPSTSTFQNHTTISSSTSFSICPLGFPKKKKNHFTIISVRLGEEPEVKVCVQSAALN